MRVSTRDTVASVRCLVQEKEEDRRGGGAEDRDGERGGEGERKRREGANENRTSLSLCTTSEKVLGGRCGPIHNAAANVHLPSAVPPRGPTPTISLF